MINCSIKDEFSKFLFELSINNSIPINMNNIDISLECKMGFIFLNIIIKNELEFLGAISNAIKTAAQAIVEDNSLDGIGVNIEVI
tara:strand:+ start:17663 stop:17917 length:255 start_codon:yes stop_codon:yes gene_type:complete